MKRTKRTLSLVLALVMVLSMVPFYVFAANLRKTLTPLEYVTVEVYDGTSTLQSTGTMDSNGTITVTDNSHTLAATGGTTVHVINSSNTDTAEIKFNYSASGYNTFSETVASDLKTVKLGPGEKYTFEINAPTSFLGAQATLTLSNFSYQVIIEQANVNFTYDSTYGSVTAAGNAVNSGASTTIDGEGAALVATAASGGTFLGWVDADTREIYSTSTSYTLVPTKTTMNVEAVFVGSGSAPYFMVGSYLFDDLNAANTQANGSGTIISVNDGTIPAGNYTISSGVTLLVPFDANNTLYTTVPGIVDNSYSKPTTYRTLTLESGANITVNGAISLSSKINSANGGTRASGAPTGSTSMVKMESGSNITVNSGGKLYAWGFITGSGTVTAKSGATVYEALQIEDFRGGSVTSEMNSSGNRVFPFTQYYFQNVEVPITLEAGAAEIGYTAVFFGTMNYSIGTTIDFIGDSDSLFTLKSGTVVKQYDGATDRLIMDVNGTMELNRVSMRIATTTVDSADFFMPINSNITVRINSGEFTVNQDMALLPSAEIIVAEGAALTISEGYSVHVYDVSEWGNYACLNGSSGTTYVAVQYAPGRTKTRAALGDATVQIDGTLNATAGEIYTTTSGANIYSTGTGVANITTGTQTETYQYVMGTGYDTVSITSAQLKNGNGDYVTTADTAGTYTYTENAWKYTCATHTGGTATCKVQAVCEVCGTSYGELADHTWNGGVETTAPGCESEGVITYTCTVDGCGETKTETIAATGHSYSTPTFNWADDNTCTASYSCAKGDDTKNVDCKVTSETTEPTCTEAGKTVYTATVTVGETEYTDTKTVTSNALDHDWNPTVNYEWNDDYTVCTATRTCNTDAEHKEVAYATITSETRAATCVKSGIIQYTATFTESWAGGFTMKAVELAIDETKHTGKTTVKNAEDATCGATGYTGDTYCADCGALLSFGTAIEATGNHSYTEEVEGSRFAATCVETGTVTMKCANCEATQVQTLEIDPGNHVNTTIVNAKEETCGEYGYTGDTVCNDCEATIATGEAIPATSEHSYGEGVVTAPTCTADGYTTYTCSVCGHSYKGDTVATTGHNWGTGVYTDPTFEADGYTTYTCTVCNEPKVEAHEGTKLTAVAQIGDTKYETLAEAVAIGDEITLLANVTDEVTVSKVVTIVKNGFTANIVAGEGYELAETDNTYVVTEKAEEVVYDLSIAGANMSLGNELAINFFVKKADIQADKQYYIIVTKTYADGRDDVVVEYQQADWMDYNTTYWGVKFNNIAAKEMADTIYVQAFYADGTAASDVWVDSIRSYAMRMYAKSNDEKKTMYVDMLNYGAAAQTEFDYGLDDLANSLLTEEHQAYATQEVEYTDIRERGTNYYGTNLNLGSSITLNMFFNNVSTDMYAIAIFTDHYGNAKEVRIEGSEFQSHSSGAYRIAIEEMAVADVRQPITCTVYNTDGAVVAYAVDSVESYIARKASSDNELYTMIMRFATSAYNYFH